MSAFRASALSIVLFLQNLVDSPLWTGFWFYVSSFLLAASVLMTVFFYVCVDRRAGYYFLISLLSVLAIGCFMKSVLREMRPYACDSRIRNIDRHTAKGYSFPSNHCMAVSSCSVSFFSYYRSILSYYMAHFWLINAFVIISRVVLGSHYLHDCIAGFAIGLVAGYFVLQLIVSHYVFFQKNRLWFGLALVAAGLTGAVLGQFGLSWFAESADAFHLTSAVGCIAVGDHLERKLIGCVCHARNMKKAIRFVFFMFSSALICMLHLMFFGRSVISLHILVVALSFYCTLGFSWLGSIMMLFERQN